MDSNFENLAHLISDEYRGESPKKLYGDVVFTSFPLPCTI